MKTYYQHKGITIYHGDCREILPNLNHPVDMVLTDPPYGINLSAKRPVNMQRHAGSTYTFGEDSPEYVSSVIVPVISDCIKMFKRVVLTPGIRCCFKYPEPTTIWALHCPGGVGLGRWSVFTCWQPVLCYGKGPKRRGSIPDTFVAIKDLADKCGHPCPKPLKTWTKLLRAVSEPQDVILDPFMGSGTTLRAAKDIGHKAIGIELEEKYCEIAAKRLAQEVLF